MNSPRPRSRQTDAEFAGVFRVAARHESRGLLVAHLDEANAILPRAERLHDAVNAVAGQAKDYLHSPIHQGLDQNIRSSLCHIISFCVRPHGICSGCRTYAVAPTLRPLP